MMRAIGQTRTLPTREEPGVRKSSLHTDEINNLQVNEDGTLTKAIQKENIRAVAN